MRIISFNINRGAHSSIVKVINAINTLEPDICVIQEVDRFIMRSGFIDQHKLIAKRCGFKKSYFFKTRTMNGFGSYGHALYFKDISHTEPESTRISSKSTLENRVAFLTNVHSQFGTSFVLSGFHLSANTSQATEELRKLIHELRFRAPVGSKLVLAGDFNLPPSSLEKYGFSIADTQFSCGVPKRTSRLDYIVGRGVNMDVHVVHLPGISDHDPVVADLETI